MDDINKYKHCIKCGCSFLTYEKYEDDDKLCPKCRKNNPITVINQKGNKNARMV